MDRRLVLPIAAFCALAGAAAMWALSPDTRTPSQIEGSQVGVEKAAKKRPRRPRPAVPLATGEGDGKPERRAHPLPPAPTYVPNDAPGRDDVLQPDRKGLAKAAASRRSDVIGCWTEWTSRHGAPPIRLTIELTVMDEGSGPVVTARLPRPEEHDDELHECWDEAFADARFNTSRGDMHRIFWPVPMPTRP